MTIDNKIKQLNRQDFVEYLYQLQMFAKEKYSFDIFLENRISQKSEFTDKINKRELGIFPAGTFKMTDDFNKPLEDFAEYM